MSERRLRVVYVANALGIGGTERGMVNHARHLDQSYFDVRVVTVQQTGPRRAELDEKGIEVSCAEGDGARLASMLEGAHIVHVFRQGIHEPLLPEACRAAGVPNVVETNIFGAVDRSPDEKLFDCHLFLSKMCLLRYRAWTGGGPDFDRRHRVLHLPIEPARLREAAPRPVDAKRMLGLDPDRPVVGRIGRAADLKWRNLLVDMAPHLLECRPDTQFLYVGTTPAKQRRLGRLGLLEHVLVHPQVSNDERLAVLYAACDVFVGAAVIGESLGLANAEAMALGIPVVTCSTPWVDNAQLELVENGRTGWVANHPRPFAEAVASLLDDPATRSRFGRAGAERVNELLGAEGLTRQAAKLYRSLAAGAGVPGEWTPSPAEVEEYRQRYPAIVRAQFRALTRRERAEARLERLRERALRGVATLDGGGLRSLTHRVRSSLPG